MGTFGDGINILSYNYDNYNCREILIETEDLKKEDVIELQKQARKLKNELGLL